jgi:hypothetical protein
MLGTVFDAKRYILVDAEPSFTRGQLRQLFVQRGTPEEKKRKAKKSRDEAASNRSGMKGTRKTNACFLLARIATCMKVDDATEPTSDTPYALFTHHIIISRANSYLSRTIRSLGGHHLLRAAGRCRDARVKVSRRRRPRDAHRIRSSTGR